MRDRLIPIAALLGTVLLAPGCPSQPVDGAAVDLHGVGDVGSASDLHGAGDLSSADDLRVVFDLGGVSDLGGAGVDGAVCANAFSCEYPNGPHVCDTFCGVQGACDPMTGGRVVSACPTDKLVGTCTVSPAPGYSATAFFYSDGLGTGTVQDAKDGCAKQMGVWKDP